VAEAKADALRLTRSEIDLDALLKVMIDLYEPSMAETGLQITLRSVGSLKIEGDESLIHRMIANLFDNELKHLPAASSVTVQLGAEDDFAMLVLEDNGPGFSPEVLPHLFERRVKGKQSNGHGLGLAFIDAVARTHGGTVTACNRQSGGAQITVSLPLAAKSKSGQASIGRV
jgi:signal transduction histidine kinase